MIWYFSNSQDLILIVPPAAKLDYSQYLHEGCEGTLTVKARELIVPNICITKASIKMIGEAWKDCYGVVGLDVSPSLSSKALK